MALSKSGVLLGLRCEKALWLSRHSPREARPPDPSARRILDQGAAVGELARRRYPGGRLIGHAADPSRALRDTARAVKEGAEVLFEAAFEAEGLLIRADVLIRRGDAWELVEVKSSTRVDDEHLVDLALQRLTLERARVPISRAGILHVDPKYVRRGPLDEQALFAWSDQTQRSAVLAGAVSERVGRLAQAAAAPEAPDVAIGPHCRSPYECPFTALCWRGVPERSIYEIARITEKKLALLRAKGVLRLREIPDDFPLTDGQRRQVEVEKSGRARVDGRAVRELLGDLDYPLHFLDFETVNPALPPFDGMSPYAQLPFQASVRVVRRPGEEGEHREFLGGGQDDPRRALASFLAEALGPRGSVVAYNAGFEARCLEGLVPFASPEGGTRLLSAQRRLWDLGEPFKQGYIAHPDFRGQWSIKAVLPALVPGMSYDGLAIRDGGQAQDAYARLMSGSLGADEAAGIAADLRAYCGQDTLAMVRLLEKVSAAAQASG
ncbi:MAG TPA: DUF2779 domain-containing protein [Elusimicrobiota bacterium]|jgi:hypothetical protein|nr:DUF2779 domain-containing protein [Elusimicrobiota bacterium]